MSALLEVKGLSRHFGELRAVQDVSFHVNEGQVLGFIGPNGAGKTTTLRILATLDTPSAGEVLLGGRSLLDEPDRVRPLLGYMPDRYGTYADTTVYEYLDFFARAYGLKGRARRERLEQVIAFTGLDGLRHRLGTELSKGMKQRAALGRTLLHDPKLLILDEPADGLDPRARIELRELLRALASEGKAILISSHILSELSELCDTCAIIEQGKLLAFGSVEQVLAGAAPGQAQECELELRLLEETPDLLQTAERLLVQQPLVARVRPGERGLRVTLSRPLGGEADPQWVDKSCAALLRALVQAQLPVCSLHALEKNLEDAFMKVTQGRVA